MPTLIKADINPDCLKWAREEAGYDTIEIAKELDVELDRYLIWEETGEKIPFGKLKSLSTKFKKQLAVFFLPKAPPKSNPPKDFRNFTQRSVKLDKSVILAFRRTERYRELAVEIEGNSHWEKRYIWTREVNHLNRDNLLAKSNFTWLREKLKISLEDQSKFSNSYYAFRAWKDSIEKNLGIFVFQFPMPMNQVQGFSYMDFSPYAIVVNNKHSYSGRIFTLFHELAHILLKDAGMCNPDLREPDESVEFLCNEFAGRFLIPDKIVSTNLTREELSHQSKFYNVSREVLLRRMYSMNYISQSHFYNELNRLKEEYNKTGNEKKNSKPSRLTVNRSYRGVMFYNMVLDAAHNNKISFNAASDVLGIGTNYLMSGKGN